jgi:hypothetical protein
VLSLFGGLDWQLSGNAGTTGGDFLGTTDNQPLEIRVNNQHAFRLEYPTSGGVPNLIGGYSGNSVGSGTEGAVIAGGGESEVENSIGAESDYSTIGGGKENKIAANALFATISGGHRNDIGVSSEYSTIGGGYDSNIGNDTELATIGGGYFNDIGADSDCSTIGGGYGNNIASNAFYAVIPGGIENGIGTGAHHAFAAGYRAKANHRGAFVWGDTNDRDVASSANDQFTVRASGGVRFFSNAALTSGVSLATGGGSWTSLSDRNAKENLQQVDTVQILEKVSTLPLTTWNYKSQITSMRHIGPTAQDFHAAFGVGDSDKTITTVDADGVALAAIQGLNGKVEVRMKKAETFQCELREQLQLKETEITELKARLEKLERLLEQRTK